MVKIIVDSIYPEETKIITINRKNKIEEFYHQNNHTKPIKGNIYLGKIDRIELSLQAVFVSYCNNRNGFLPFNMIHPKYYQVTEKEKKKLLLLLGINKGKNDENVHKILNSKYKMQEVIKKNQIILVQVEKEEKK